MNRLRSLLLSYFAAIFAISPSAAYSIEDCATVPNRIDRVRNKLANFLAKDYETSQSGPEEIVRLTSKINKDIHDVLLEIKEIGKKEYYISYYSSIPMLAAIQEPKAEIKNTKIGQYPEFTCTGLTCEIKYKDIFAQVPEMNITSSLYSIDFPYEERLKVPLVIVELQNINSKLESIGPTVSALSAMVSSVQNVNEATDTLPSDAVAFLNSMNALLSKFQAILQEYQSCERVKTTDLLRTQLDRIKVETKNLNGAKEFIQGNRLPELTNRYSDISNAVTANLAAIAAIEGTLASISSPAPN